MSKLNWQYNSMSSSGKLLLKSLIYDLLTVTMTKKPYHSPVHTHNAFCLYSLLFCAWSFFFLLPVLFSILLYTFTLSIVSIPPIVFFFACWGKTQLLPKDSLICILTVAQHIAWSPDKEMQRKACVSESRLHHHWNAPVHSIIYHTLPLVCACMWTCACEYIRAYSSYFVINKY